MWKPGPEGRGDGRKGKPTLPPPAQVPESTKPQLGQWGAPPAWKAAFPKAPLAWRRPLPSRRRKCLGKLPRRHSQSPPPREAQGGALGAIHRPSRHCLWEGLVAPQRLLCLCWGSSGLLGGGGRGAQGKPRLCSCRRSRPCVGRDWPSPLAPQGPRVGRCWLRAQGGPARTGASAGSRRTTRASPACARQAGKVGKCPRPCTGLGEEGRQGLPLGGLGAHHLLVHVASAGRA